MKANDDLIKKTLQTNVQRIDDNSFTKGIIENHLSNRQNITSKPFINFISLIIGLCFMISGIGFVVLIRYNYGWLKEIGLTENHGLLIVSISFIFLICKLMEEFTAPNIRYNQ